LLIHKFAVVFTTEAHNDGAGNQHGRVLTHERYSVKKISGGDIWQE
jgi:hypothetical protein